MELKFPNTGLNLEILKPFNNKLTIQYIFIMLLAIAIFANCGRRHSADQDIPATKKNDESSTQLKKKNAAKDESAEPVTNDRDQDLTVTKDGATNDISITQAEDLLSFKEKLEIAKKNCKYFQDTGSENIAGVPVAVPFPVTKYIDGEFEKDPQGPTYNFDLDASRYLYSPQAQWQIGQGNPPEKWSLHTYRIKITNALKTDCAAKAITDNGNPITTNQDQANQGFFQRRRDVPFNN